MALMTTTSADSTSGESHPSSPELDQASPDMDPSSSNQTASPISLPSSLSAANLHDAEHEERSSRSTPTRSSPSDLTRNRSAGRGGCWTCRVRRKKCDEERVDGDSCRTCKRLGIKCLGWGPRRPDWMRDKDKVAQYKADIKAQLTRAGLIRGQPRAMYTSLTSGTSTAPSRTSGSTTADRYAPPAVAGPGPSTSTLRSRRSDPYGVYPHTPGYDSSAPYHRPTSSMMSALPGMDPVGVNGTADLSLPSPFVMNNNSPFSHPSSMYGNDLHSLPNMSAFNPFIVNDVPSSVSPLQPMRGSPLNEPAEPYISYYFENVRKVQFAFAGPDLTQVLYLILHKDPQGPLEHAICALASLHSTRSNGYDTASVSAEKPLHKRFFDQGNFLLLNACSAGRHPTESDAIAAVYLIGYYIMVAVGSTAWTQLLDVACDWFAQTGITEEQNPKLMLLNMNDVQRIAAKMTMWIDIMSSLVFRKTPRYLSVYRRLLGGGGAGFWATTGNERLELRMDKLTGCPDEAMLAFAEIAHLAVWKHTEQQKGSLSMRELIRRGDQIEHALRQHPLRSSVDSPTADTGPILPSGMPAAAGMFSPFDTSVDDLTRRTIPQVWRETAVLYLHTILSESHPSVPEISKSVHALMDLFNGFAPSDFDRCMLFPLVLTAFLCDDPFYRDFLKGRLTVHQDAAYSGSMAQAARLVDYVWARRDALAAANATSHPHAPRTSNIVDWRDCMRERWSSLLLV